MAVSNTMGTQVLWDGEVPRTFTAVAAEVISGGEYVACSGAVAGAVGSSISSYDVTDTPVVLVTALACGVETINGIAINTAASGALVTIATRGAYLVQAGGSVIAGNAVEALDEELVQSLTSGIVPSGKFTRIPGGKKIGRALSAGASGITDNYCLVYFNF